MRVGLVGNVCNNHYVLAKALRKKGVDAHVYFPDGVLQQSPYSEDSELLDQHVDWLHPFKPESNRLLGPYSPPDGLLNELKGFDLLHAHAEGLLWAAESGTPYIFHPHGIDFVKFPFLRWTKKTFPYVRNPLTMRASRRMRGAIIGAERIVLSWNDRNWIEGYEFLHDNGAWNRIARLPLAIDATRFAGRSGDTAWPDAALHEALAAFEIVAFMPTRQMFMPNTVLHMGAKGNDIFYRALAELVHQHGARIAVVIVDKGDFDTPEAKRMIAELRLEPNVFWIPRMKRHALVEHYHAADLVVDGMIAGALGSIPIEALACGTPVMMRMDAESEHPLFLSPYETFQELPPIMNVRDENDVVATMLSVRENKLGLRERGRLGRTWAESSVDGQVVAPRYIALYEQVLRETRE